jgi:hypothetical protein
MAMAPVDRQRAHNEQYGEPGTNRTAARLQLHGYLANCTTGMFQTSMLNGRKYQALVLWPVSDHTSPDPRNEKRASRSMVTKQSVRIDWLTTMQKRAADIIESHV